MEAVPVTAFAAALESALNSLEEQEFEVDDILDAPQGRGGGVVIIGKKPLRFPVPLDGPPRRRA